MVLRFMQHRDECRQFAAHTARSAHEGCSECRRRPGGGGGNTLLPDVAQSALSAHTQCSHELSKQRSEQRKTISRDITASYCEYSKERMWLQSLFCLQGSFMSIPWLFSTRQPFFFFFHFTPFVETQLVVFKAPAAKTARTAAVHRGRPHEDTIAQVALTAATVVFGVRDSHMRHVHEISLQRVCYS